jgi:hypothetical protein
MKKIYFVFSIFIAVIMSCQVEEKPVDNLLEEPLFILKKLDNNVLLNSFNKLKNENFSSFRKLDGISFQNEDVFELEIQETGEKFLLLNQDGFKESNSSNFGFAVSIKDKVLGEITLVQTERAIDGKLIINYFSKSMQLVSSVEMNPELKSFSFISGSKENSRLLCGDGVAGCIADAYTNHGWVSVWAFVQTGFIPATGLALAAACAALNCL